MKQLKNAILIAIVLIIPAASVAQTTLRIGDSAPPFKYAKWIKGTPIDTYKPDHLYVVEFWATWCGPCKGVMPHLSELAEKYKAEATFVSVNIWEKVGNKPYESSLPAVISFVNSMGSKMAYHVIADNNAQDMSKTWMKPAGQNGIPATFMVKNGKIIWIGHPIALDSILPLAVSGKYDMNAYKKGFDAKNEVAVKAVDQFNASMDPALAAMKAKAYDKAIAILDKGEVENPKFGILFKRVKAKALLSKDELAGLAYIKAWVAESDGVSSTLASDIIERDDLSKLSYNYAAEVLNDFVSKGGGMPMIAHMLAIAYAKAGDLSAAVAAEKMAVEQATVALKEKKFSDMVFPATLTEYEQKLKEYQEKANLKM